MKHFILLFLILSVFSSYSQNCYIDSAHSVQSSSEEIAKYFANKRQEAVTHYIPLKIHAVVDEVGNTIDLAALNRDVINANKAFSTINVQFYICSAIHYIRKPELYVVTSDMVMDSLTKNSEASVINVFYVGGIPYRQACGLATLGSSNNGFILIDNSCSGADGGTFIHEMGHYFNLLHPHDAYNGIKELVDGSNCSTGGDLLCDTPADPNLYGKVSQNCSYTGTDKDPANQLYKPDVSNFMSYTLWNCRNKFTTQQFQKMQFYLENTLLNKVNCTMKTDLICSLSAPSNKLAPGTTYQLKLAITNNSFVAYSGNIGYSILLKDKAGVVVNTVSFTTNKTLGTYATDTVLVSWTVPAGFTEGIYTLNAELDPQNLIAESVDNNNSSKTDIGIFSSTTSIADIELKVNGPSIHYSGYEYKITFTCQNIGTKDAGNYSIRTFVSNDPVPSIDDVYYGGGYGTLSIGQIYAGSDQFTMPTKVETPLYIIVVASLSSSEVESNIANNTQIIKVTNIYPPAKLKKADLVFTGTDIPSGKSVEQLWQIGGTFDYVNNGDTNFVQMPMNLYLSKDASLDALDKLLSTSFTRMSGKKGIWNSIYGYIPPGTTLGAYYLIAYIDPYNYVLETNEDNNLYSVPINVIAGSASDLVMTNIVFPDTVWIYGQGWNFKSTIKNQGLKEAETPEIFYYLEKDISNLARPPFRNSLSRFAYEYLSTPIPVGGSYEQSFTGTIDNKTEPGIYYFATCVDNRGSEYPDNNCVVFNKPVKVLAKPTRIEEEDENNTSVELFLFPNPVTDKLSIRSSQEIRKVDMYSVDGRKSTLVYQDDMIDVSGLPSGIYQLRIQLSNLTVSRSFIKR